MGTAARVGLFTESVIREMTRLNVLYHGINLAQGFPDFDPPPELVDAAARALRDGVHQYAITWGAPPLRAAIAEKFARDNGVEVDPERHVTVTCGATEAMMATLLALLDPGDEVVIFEPFYENYVPDALLAGAVPRFVRLHQEDAGFAFDPAELRAAFGSRTRAVIVNTPHNPTGKVFSRDELELVADLCRTFGAVAVTDEVYEHILYDGARHVSLAALPGMAERTVTINSMSKTYSVTGWRVGWAIARDPQISDGIRRAHDFLTVGAAAPLQQAAVTALRFPPAYYRDLAAAYQARRDRMMEILVGAGFRPFRPQGAYYVMADFSALYGEDDVSFARRLVTEVGVAAVPGSSFYHTPGPGRSCVRFAFPKREETLDRAGERLRRMRREAAR
jgi:aminotransferase